MRLGVAMSNRRGAGATERPRSALAFATIWRAVPILALLASLAGCASTPEPAVLSGNDRLALAQVSTYLDNLQRFRADFAQSGPKGIEKGVVWLDRPGRLRVEYYYPGPETILANHGQLLILDPSTGATTTMPVSRTPLAILLRAHIPLTGPVTVTSLQRRAGMLSVTLVSTNAPGQGTLTLTFSANPLTLRGLTIQDRTGRITQLALGDIVRDPRFAPSAFTAAPPSG